MGSPSEEPKSEVTPPAGAPTRPKSKMMIAVVVAVVLIIAALAGAWAVGVFEKKEEKVLVIAMTSDVETMNPARTSAMYGPPGMIYETLISRDLNGAYVPGLAEWWNMNRSDPDNPKLEIRLKQGVKYHDGTPFNSHSVKRTIEWYAQNESWVAYEFYAIKGCPSYWGTTDYSGWPDVGIWCKDDYNLVLNLTWADVALIFNISHLYGSMIGPDALWELGVENYGIASNYRKVIGTGPFKMSEWVPGDHITLVKNEDYNWGASWYVNKGPAKIDKIIYRIIPDQAARLAGFESGAIDILQQVPPSKVATYRANPDMTVITAPGQGTYHIDFNCQKAPWDNFTLRRAFGFAINRTQILQTVWYGIGQEGTNILPPIMPESRNVPAEYNYSYDVSKAMALFAAAGWQNRDSDVWLENESNVELTLPLWTTNKDEDVLMAEILLTQFQSIGVHVQLAQYGETDLRSRASEGLHDAILFWFSWPRAEILDWHFGDWASPNGSGYAHFHDPDVFDKYVANWTFAETEEAFSENATLAHIRLLTQAPRIPIIFWHQIFAIHNHVVGWYVHPLGQEQTINILDVDIQR